MLILFKTAANYLHLENPKLLFMKKYLIHPAIALCCLLIFTLPSCVSTNTVANKITVGSGEIPPDMAKEKFIIIGMYQGRNSYDKYMERGFASYGGEYVLAEKKELATKYSDTKKYRYILDCQATEKRNDPNVGFEPNRPGNPEQGKYKVIEFIYHIVDRQTGKIYYRKHGSSAFGKEIKAYVTAIDKARLQ